MKRLIGALVCLAVIASSQAVLAQDEKIPWIHTLDDSTFKRAADEKKLILLDLEAIWCHWCHVMRNKTYSQADVQKEILAHFIPVRIDQDSRPDLSTRYNDYGWPATIVLSAKGEDLIKRSGFIPQAKMVEMLVDVYKNPVPHEDEADTGEELNESASLTPAQRKEITDFLDSRLDRKQGGINSPHHWLGPEWPESILRAALAGNKEYESFIKLSLKNNLKLHDPEWGGVYQYSTDYGWDVPHFEKIGSTQANNIRIYSFAYSAYREDWLLKAAQNVRNYMKNFLMSPDGAFYTSQDADLIQGEHSEEYFALKDADRRKQGIPRIDKHMYSNENGTMITAFTRLYAASGDPAVLDDAIKAARWIIANRSLPGGGFRHDEKDPGGPYLADTLNMGNAFMHLYGVTGDREWLTKSVDAANFIRENFVEKGKQGYLSFSLKTAGILKPGRLAEENVPAARYLNLLSHYTGQEKFHEDAIFAMKWLTSPKLLDASSFQPGLVMADIEVASAPLHITVVGSKNDAKAQELYKAAMAYPNTYKRLDWWDRAEGPMPNPDVQYPQLDKSAAFICTGKKCSFPIFEPDGVAKTIIKATAVKTPVKTN
jgi:uncharacterized protein YyaL (SSP411 family)